MNPPRRSRPARLLAAIALMSGLIVAAAPGPGLASPAPNLSWTELLPPLPSSSAVQPGAVPGCRKSSIECMDLLVERMSRIKRRFRCDHRGVFATTYLELTKALRRSLKRDSEWRFRRYLYTEAAYFAHYYFRTLRRWEQGKPVPPAWRIALETAEGKSVLGAQDMLLGINAHVQSDMPFVIAAIGVRTRRGETRKPDHDYTNQVLNDAYERVVAAVRARFDPSLGLSNPEGIFADDLAGLEMVRIWREGVWRNAERLMNARTPADREAVGNSILQFAAGWASGMAAVEFPGHRAERDSYCEERLAARG